MNSYHWLQVIQARKQEIDQHGRSGPAKTSERIRSKRTSRVGPVPSSRALAVMEAPGSDTEPDVKVNFYRTSNNYLSYIPFEATSVNEF